MKSKQELTQAYQIVNQDLVYHLAKIKDGEGIHLDNLGTFIKKRQKIKDWNKKSHTYWRISFRASVNLKKELDKNG